MSKRDYYEILGLSKTATPEEIKKAYRKFAMENHPDRNPDNKEAEERFKEGTEAYEVLSDADKRARYDRFGHEAMRGGQDFHQYGNAGDIFSQFEDIFGDFFGGGRPRSRGPNRRSSGTPGGDLRVKLKLTLEEIAVGTEKKIKLKRFIKCNTCGGSGAEPGSQRTTCTVCNGTGEIKTVSRSVFGQFVNIQTCNNCNGEGTVITKPCRSCNGDGRVSNEETVTVSVPAGVTRESIMTMRGQGHVGSRGGAPGDLLITFEELPHEYFTREGDDVFYDLHLSFPDLTLGTEVVVPTLSNKTNVIIDPGTPHGKLLRMRGKGIKRLNQNTFGDQIIRISVVVPKHVNKKEKELLEELRKLPDFKPHA